MMRKNLWMLAAILICGAMLTGCSVDDNEINDNRDPQPTPVDRGPSYSDKTVTVNRDGNTYGQVSLRFYSDMPSVAYISVADFHKIMTGGEAMRVTRQGDLYELTTKSSTANGQNFMISSYRDRSTDVNFVNNDTGVEPNEGYAFGYDHFYDLDFLTTKLQR